MVRGGTQMHDEDGGHRGESGERHDDDCLKSPYGDGGRQWGHRWTGWVWDLPGNKV